MDENLVKIEMALLGSAFKNSGCARWLVANVPPEAYIRSQHQTIAKVIADLVRDEVDLDELTIERWLQFIGESVAVPYLAEIIDHAFMYSNRRVYAKTVLDEYAKRQIEQRANGLLADLRTRPVEESKALCFEIGRNLDGVGSDTLLSSEIRIGDEEHLLPGISTGIAALDVMTSGGYYAAEPNLIVAKRGCGKTSWMVGGAITGARAGKKVGYATLEMPAVKLQARMVQWLCGWSKRPIISDRLIEDFDQAESDVRAFGIRWFDPSRLKAGDRTIERLVAWAVDVHDAIGLDELFIDYGQKLTTSRRGENRTRELDYVADEIEWLAKRLRIPVIVASQLSADPLGKGPGRSKDSIRFEDNAALVIYLTREMKSAEAKCLVGKNRHGPEDVIEVAFDRSRARYFDPNETEPEAPEPPQPEKQPALVGAAEEDYDPFADE